MTLRTLQRELLQHRFRAIPPSLIARTLIFISRKEAQKVSRLVRWWNRWATYPNAHGCAEGLGARVFREMVEDEAFRKMMMWRLTPLFEEQQREFERRMELKVKKILAGGGTR